MSWTTCISGKAFGKNVKLHFQVMVFRNSCRISGAFKAIWTKVECWSQIVCTVGKMNLPAETAKYVTCCCPLSGHVYYHRTNSSWKVLSKMKVGSFFYFFISIAEIAVCSSVQIEAGLHKVLLRASGGYGKGGAHGPHWALNMC